MSQRGSAQIHSQTMERAATMPIAARKPILVRTAFALAAIRSFANLRTSVTLRERAIPSQGNAQIPRHQMVPLAMTAMRVRKLIFVTGERVLEQLPSTVQRSINVMWLESAIRPRDCARTPTSATARCVTIPIAARSAKRVSTARVPVEMR